MKLWTAFALLFFAAALVACTQTQQAPQQQTSPQGQSAAETAGNATAATQSTTVAADAAAADLSSAHVVEINMTAQDFQFNPDTITVRQGDRVIIHLVSSDDDHGLAIQGYDQQVKFGAGDQGTTLDFIADKPGTFTFYCNVPCGPGHRSMHGQLIVVAA